MKNDDYSKFWKLTHRYNFNPGSFGATPHHILEKQAQWQADFHADREGFYATVIPAAVAKSKSVLADFVGADIDDIVFVDNATDGINSVIKSLALGAGDEVIVTNFMYGPFHPFLQEISLRSGFKIIKSDIPYPPKSDDAMLEPVLSAVTKKTKLVIIDHVSSPTGIVLPVKRLVAALNALGIDTFVDGAHAPGQMKVDVADVGAAYYTANHHKWICAPLASGFLHVRKDRQDLIMPAVGSMDANRNESFTERFGWVGTKEVSARVFVGETIEYMASLHPDGWDGIYQRNHEVALAARSILLDHIPGAESYPDHMVGNMFTLSLGNLRFPSDIEGLYVPKRLQTFMVKEHGFGAYATLFNGSYLLRIGVPLFLNLSDFEVFAKALQASLGSLSKR